MPLLRTVSADTYLFPAGLDFGLGVNLLAITPGIKSCFLCNQVGMSGRAAVEFAKQLDVAHVYSVGDFLSLTHAECAIAKLAPTSVFKLDRCLPQFPDLPENQHAPGTVVPTWLSGATALAHPTGDTVHHDITRPPARMFCDAPSLALSLLVCHFGCPRPLCWCTGL